MTGDEFDKQASRLYSTTPLVGGWVRRKALEALARDRSPAAVRALAQAAAAHNDSRVRALARETLGAVSGQPSIDMVCATWAATRSPELASLMQEKGWLPSGPAPVRVLVALKTGEADAIARGGSEVADPLVQACLDADPVIAQAARQAVVELSSGSLREVLVDEICARWAHGREPILEELVVSGHIVAVEPLSIRMLSALKTGQGILLTDLGPEVVEPLLAACEDTDQAIAGPACSLLRELKNPGARDALCRVVVERDPPQARAAALEARYLPRDEYQRAAFLFLTDQSERYEALDFDRRLLRAIYESASPGVRRRILERLRAAGRTDFLTVVAGSDFRNRLGSMAPGEFDFLVQMLINNREWEKLWSLAFELPFSWSVHVVRVLGRTGWRPQPGDDSETFHSLVALVEGPLLPSAEELASLLPPAIECARVKVTGRVSDVAFSPLEPQIAIGTGKRRLVLWNFRKGERDAMMGGFTRSIGRVSYASNGALLCAERADRTFPGAIHLWQDGSRTTLPSVREYVTAMEPVGDSSLLITARDHSATLWNTGDWSIADQKRLDFWPRAACISPAGAQVALLHKQVTLASLPGLNLTSSLQPGELHSVSVCACFSPGGETLVVGKHYGHVLACDLKVGKGESEQVLATHQGPVRGVQALPGRPLIITAGADGIVQFISWPSRALAGAIHTTDRRLTSVCVSPDGAFLAIGHSDATMSLWDLRTLDMPLLFARPLAQALPVHLSTTTALAASETLEPRLRPWIRFMEEILRRRFRYDIQVDEIPAIKVGDFDIEIEG